MRLIKCYIENFGTLHDFSYDFSDGINEIQQENGWGKTTFGVFVKAMFYGLEYAPRKKTAEYERKKYYPWQGGNFGGSLELEIRGKHYKMERYFGKKDKEDSFVLYDLKTGLVSQDYTDKIGEEIFHIDMESYERSTYIPQNGISISMTDSINAKLSNLVENGNDINNYENAYAKLEEHLKEYKKTGGRGKIAQLQEKIFAKQDEIEECKNKAEGMALIEAQIEQQLVQRRGLELIRNNLKEEVLKASAGKEQAAKGQHYESLKKRVADITEQKKPFDAIFTNGLPTEDELEAVGGKFKELTNIEQERALAHLNEEEEKQLDTLDEFFVAGCPDMPLIEMYLGESSQSVKIKDEIIRLRTSIEMREAQKEQEKARMQAELEKEKELQRAAFEKAKEKVELQKRVLLTIAILIFALGAGSFLTTLPVWIGYGGLAAGVVLLLITITRRAKEAVQPGDTSENESLAVENETAFDVSFQEETAKLQTELDRLTAQEEEIQEHYRIFIEQFAVKNVDENPIQLLAEIKAKAMEYQNLSTREDERREQFEKLTTEITEKQAQINSILREIHVKYVQQENLRIGYELLLADIKEYQRLERELEKSRLDLQEFVDSNPDIRFDREDLEQVEAYVQQPETVSLEELQEQEKRNESAIEDINKTIHSYRKDMDAMSVIVDMQNDFEEELESMQNELAESQYRCGILEKTMQYLKEAKESFSTHYMGAMQKGFQKYAALMNGGKSKDIRLDVRLDAQKSVGGSLKGSEYFSTGNRDFIGICIRFALIDALFEEEKPFIILDDPFVNLDDEKVKNARNLLKEIAGEYQIIYLVCHSSRGMDERGIGR